MFGLRAIAAIIFATVNLAVCPTSKADNPIRVSLQVKTNLPLSKASVQGKYRRLLRVIHVPQDKETYMEFQDYGYYTGSEWAGHKNIPAGHWVYVHPHWYIWGEKKQ